MEIKRELLNHFKFLQKSLDNIKGAEAFLNINNFTVMVRIQNKVYRLYPRFVSHRSGKTSYTPDFSNDVILFIGWRPYQNRRTPELGKKLVFKNFLSENNFNHPRYSLSDASDLNTFIIKKDISAFAQGIRGPYNNSQNLKIVLDDDEYYEELINGDIAKIWFLNSDPICIELKPMPFIIGDGHNTIQKLAELKRKRRGLQLNWLPIEKTIALKDYQLDSVLEKNCKLIVDFRYTSPFLGPEDIKETLAPTEDQNFSSLKRLGDCIWENLPEDWKDICIYSVDAIKDERLSFQFLEVNFAPFVHPAVYPQLIKNLYHIKNFQEI